MASCPCEKKIFLIAYNNEVDAVKATHPDFTQHEVSLLAAQTLRPRFLQDLAAAKTEDLGLESYEVDDVFTMTADGARWTGYGRLMRELNERTARLTPDQYVQAEDQTTRLIETALRNGARRILTSYWRPDQNQRDILEITYDPEKNRGKMRVITAGLVGTNYDFKSITTIAKSSFGDLTFQQASDKAFILTDVPIPTHKLSEIRSTRFSDETMLAKEFPVENVLRVDQYKTPLPKEQPAPSLQRPIGEKKRDHGRNIVAEIKVTQREGRNVDTTLFKDNKDKRPGILAEIQNIHTEKTKALASLSNAARLQVGIGAAPFLLTVLTEGLPRPIRAIEKSISRHQKKEAKRLYRERRKMREGQKRDPQKDVERVRKMSVERKSRRPQLKEKEKAKESVVFTQQRRRKREKPRRFSRYMVELGRTQMKKMEMTKIKKIKEQSVTKEKKYAKRSKEATNEVVVKARKERRLRRVREERESGARKLFKRSKELTQRPIYHEKVDRTGENLRLMRKEKKRKEYKATVRFTFAWILWLLFDPSRRELASPKLTAIDGLTFKQVDAQEAEIIADKLITQKPTQWLLLSIIFYMTMLTEAAMPKANNKKIKKRKTPFPQRGVIFAFQSW